MTEPLAVPEALRSYVAGLEKMSFPDGAVPFERCFGCGPAHPTGLHVQCFRTASGVLSPIMIPRVYEGPRGAAHGGIVAAYLDEVCGAAAARATGRLMVTGELTVRYVEPVPTETPLLGRGSLVEDYRKYADVEATLEQVGTGRVVARARGRFFDYQP